MAELNAPDGKGTVKCDGGECVNRLDLSSMETFPEGASALEIHVREGDHYLKMNARLCNNCTSKLMDSFRPPEAKT